MNYRIFWLLICCSYTITSFPIRGRILCSKEGKIRPQDRAIIALRDNQGYNLGYNSNTESDKFGRFYIDAISFATTHTLELEVHHTKCGEAKIFKKNFDGLAVEYDFGDLQLDE